ncbi:sigma factor-like helix-turn-helix DNA-binding protein [Neobacillus sp. NPDC058068]
MSGYSPSEIAEELGIEPAAVRANLMKARRAVALRMRDREEGA